MSQFIDVDNIFFTYPGFEHEKPVLRGLSFHVQKGEVVAIRGPSGSGKSTLLYLIGCMNRVQSGSIKIDNHDIQQFSRSEASQFRNKKIGFIFQQFHLLPKLTVKENILLPLQYRSTQAKSFQHSKSQNKNQNTQTMIFDQSDLQHLNFLCKLLDIESILSSYPNKISGGQQQRVAIARALINNPEIILADEPTGNLDSINAKNIISELLKLKQLGKTVIIITHDPVVAASCDRVIHIQDGVVVKEDINPNQTSKLNSSNSSDLTPHALATESSSLHSMAIANKTINTLTTSKIIKNSFSNIKDAFVHIKQNKVRSILNMLGISIGIASVLIMTTLGQFAKEKILSGYAELGVNTLIFNGWPNWQSKATDNIGQVFLSFNWEKDIVPLKSIFPNVQRVSPVLRTWGTKFSFAGKFIDQDARLVGINDETLLITKQKLLAGIFINSYHVATSSPVCVIGYEIAERLFNNTIALGEILTITDDEDNNSCRVIGIMQNRSTRSEWRNPNLEVYVPYTYFQAKSKNWWSVQIREVLLELKDGSPIQETGNGVRAFFERKYGNTGRFRVDSDSILIEQMNQFLNIFTGFLIAVAFISLTVGGIGIANMMLVSVNERFKEIGIRKAVGASDKNIRKHFLSESVLICTLAGLIGLIGGIGTYQLILWGATKLIPKVQYEWIFNPLAIFISVVSIFIVGIVSGITPAIRAERLSPMQALRSD